MDTNPASAFTVLLGFSQSEFRDDLFPMFSSGEYTILTAGSGEEVLSKFNEHPEISLVIITIELGGSNGFEVLRQLKSRRSVTPVFLLAAYISFESLKLASLYGCDELLQIPVRKRDLMALINKYLHNQ